MIEYPDPADCLGASACIDSDASSIREFVQSHTADDSSEAERAVRLFEFVRDEFEYEFTVRTEPEVFRASFTLEERKGNCVRKSILLCALCRVAGIPAALIFSNMRDRTLPPVIVAAMGTDIMFHHCMAGLYLGGKWLQVDSSLPAPFAEKKGYRLAEFDGKSDAMPGKTTLSGEPHMECVEYVGAFADFDCDVLMAGYTAGYANCDPVLMDKFGLKRVFP